MEALDAWFVECLAANPDLRAHVGSLGDLGGNQLGRTLERLCYRANLTDETRAESIDGGIIAARHAGAVSAGAFGNKGGINLIVSNEDLATKLLVGLRHEIQSARHQREAGTGPVWFAVPLIASPTWEEGGNGALHMDPSLAEALMGEMSDTARVLFPIDANTAVAALRALYGVAASLPAWSRHGECSRAYSMACKARRSPKRGPDISPATRTPHRFSSSPLAPISSKKR